MKMLGAFLYFVAILILLSLLKAAGKENRK